ncbi:glycosyltransferase family 1 protein [Pseudonocardiaceae bacterium YIM PH 21723]|nr:glycosyltransferase family 1 protein [Pseudonocardiaceae bacterium YIM PH 21723]
MDLPARPGTAQAGPPVPGRQPTVRLPGAGGTAPQEARVSICFVTIYPLDRRDLGGSGFVDRRLVKLLDAAFGDVEVCSVTGPDGDRTELGVPAYSTGSLPLEIRGDKGKLLRVATSMLVSTEPYLARKFTAFPGWHRAAALLAERSAGRKVITSGWPALLLAEAAGVDVHAHVAHNVESTIAAEHSPRPLRMLGENWRLGQAERRLLKLPGSVFALSRSDAATLTEWGIETKPLPLPLWQQHRDASANAVGFIGKASWPPNARALDTLVGPVRAELLRMGGGDTEYVLAGKGTEEFAGRPGVTALGRVEEEADFYRKVGLVVVPRFGASTGISVKMLEAAEHGVASVVPPQLADAVDPEGPWLVAGDSTQTAEVIMRWRRGETGVDPQEWTRRQDGSATAAALGPALGLDSLIAPKQ